MFERIPVVGLVLDAHIRLHTVFSSIGLSVMAELAQMVELEMAIVTCLVATKDE